MDPTVVAAALTVVGMLGVGVLGAFVQTRTTRTILHAERLRVSEQIRTESAHRRREQHLDRLLDAVSELVACTDPEVNARIDYPEVVKLIHRTQLLLNRDNAREAQLNGAINELGLALGSFLSSDGDNPWTSPETRAAVLGAHGRIIDLAQAVILGYSGKSFLGP